MKIGEVGGLVIGSVGGSANEAMLTIVSAAHSIKAFLISFLLLSGGAVIGPAG